MYKVLIVDDEVFVVSLIEKLVNWNALDMEIIGTAHDGIDALESVEKLKPDIVIVDVRMPGYDGITLMEKVGELNKDIHFIVISGHKKFEYAKSAMKFNVEDYLLKPISKHELETILSNLKFKLDKKHADAKAISLLDNQFDMSKNTLKHHLAKQLLDENITILKKPIDDINSTYFTNLSDGIYQCLLLKVDSSNLNIDDMLLENLLQKMEKVTIKHLVEHCTENILISKDSMLWCFISIKMEHYLSFQKSLKTFHENVKSIFEKFDHLYITTSAGTPQDSFEKIMESKQTAFQCMISRTVLGLERYITYDMVQEDIGTIQVIFSDTHKKKLLDTIKSLSSEKLRVQIIEAFSRAEEYKYKNTMIFYETYLFIIGMFYDYVNSVQIFKGTKDELLRELHFKMQFASSSQDISRILCQYLDNFITQYVKENETGENPAVRIAKRYIANHYQNSISLNSMAEIVHLSPVYFSILFKKEEGINFLDYLNQYRIDMAKKLLKNVKYNINEVASLCGFQDARYFSKIFKKSVGITPKDYRSRNI